MIPLRDVIPSPTPPRVTILLLATHALVFLGMSLVGEDRAPEILRQNAAGVDGRWCLAAAGSLFLHATGLTLAIDLGALWLFGENVEDRFGHARFLASYVTVGMLAALAGALVTPGGWPWGASGATAGVLAAYLRLFPTSRILAAVPTGLPGLAELPASALAAAWFLLQIATGTPAVTLLTGAAAGVLAARLLPRPERMRVEWWGK